MRRGARAALAPLILAAAMLAATGCSDPFALKAQYSNEPFIFTVFGMSGKGPANAPAALDLLGRAVMKVDGSFAFDIAFDLDGKGKIVVLPQRLVGTPIAGSRVVYLRRMSGPYDAALLAPSDGWMADSTVSVLPGEPVGIKLTPSSCAYQISTDMYAKIFVDSVTAGGLIFGRGVLNPNCGFKSFADGIPTK
jgi:hypothetical protein